MNKLKKFLFQIITIFLENPNKLPMTTPTREITLQSMLSIASPPIGSNLGLHYSIIDINSNAIIFYLF